MRRLTLMVGLLSLLAAPSSAAPILVDLSITSGSSGGFGYSFLHAATSSCTSIGGTQFCMNGAKYSISIGSSLTGTLDGLHLYGISGTLDVIGGGDIIVTDGFIHFNASDPDTFGGKLVTSTHGTFYFLDHTFAGPANSFDGTDAFLWGNNWDSGTAAGHADPDWGIDLGLRVTPALVPEPSAAGLFSIGILLAGTFARNRRV
jgi:hypothetical protein